MSATIVAKAQALQEAMQLENEQKKIRVKAQNDIIEAKRDSTVLVVGAQAEARAIREKQSAITPEYVEYQKVLKWNGVQPTVVGGNSGMILQLKQ